MKPVVFYNQFFWNLDQSVGRRASNGNATDIALVQWMLRMWGNSALAPSDAARNACRAVQVTGTCHDADDDKTVEAIRARQQDMHHRIHHVVVDGHVSVAHGHGAYAPHAAFMILDLCAELATLYPQTYPRIDMMPGCPGVVAAAVRQAIPKVK